MNQPYRSGSSKNFCPRANFPKEYILNSETETLHYGSHDKRMFDDQYCNCTACFYNYKQYGYQGSQYFYKNPSSYFQKPLDPQNVKNNICLQDRKKDYLSISRDDYLNTFSYRMPEGAIKKKFLPNIEEINFKGDFSKMKKFENPQNLGYKNFDTASVGGQFSKFGPTLFMGEKNKIPTMKKKSKEKTENNNLDVVSTLFIMVKNGIVHKNCRDFEIAMNILRLTDGDLEITLKVLLTGAYLPTFLPYEIDNVALSSRWKEHEIELFKMGMAENLYLFKQFSQKIGSKTPIECKLFFIKEFYIPEKLFVKRFNHREKYYFSSDQTEHASDYSFTANLFLSEAESGVICRRCYLYLTRREQEVNETNHHLQINNLVSKIKETTQKYKEMSLQINICKLCDSPIALIQNIDNVELHVKMMQ